MNSLHSLLTFSGLASAAAALLNLAGWGQYLRAQAQGLSESSPVNWLVSLLLVSCAWAIQSRVSTPLQSLMYAAGAVLCLAVLLMSLRNPWKFSRADASLLGVSVLLLVALWKEPHWAVGMMSLYYLDNYFSFSRKILLGQTRESPGAWWIWVAAAACLLLAQPPRDPLAWVLPATNFFCWAAVLTAIAWRRRLDSSLAQQANSGP